MTPGDYEKVKEIFNSVLEIEPEDRAAFLDERCDGENGLREEVERLLASCDSEFLETPAAGSVAGSVESGGFSAGHSIGHYTVLRKIGSGGMGEVYLAEDVKLGRKVAIKILPDPYTTDPDRLSRFQLEARSASSLNHPNIITIHEIDEHDGTQFIATEYVDGETLRHRLHREQLSITEALDYGVQLAAAISAAHEAGITHRDLKPENIMIRRDRIVKVLDFGLAKQWNFTRGDTHKFNLNDEPTVRIVNTEPGVILGTVQYMSPEQSRGQITDARSDIWSLGCVLYEMFAGEPAFKGDSSADLIAEIVKTRPVPISKLNSDCPERLDEIVSKSLEKSVEDRYQTCRDLYNDLKTLKRKLDVSEIGEVSSPPTSTDPELVHTTAPNLINTRSGPKDLTTVRGREYLIWGIKAHRLMSFWIALFVISLLVGTAFLVRKYWRGPNEARIEYANKIRLAAQALDGSNLEQSERLLNELKPDIGETDVRGFEWGYLSRLLAERKATQPLPLAHDGGVNDVVFSRNGEILATAAGDNKARLWDVSTGQQIAEFSGHSKPIASVALSPDGTKLATGSFDKTAKLWDIATGQVLWTVEGKGQAIGRLAFSPDGKLLAGEDDTRQIKLWDVSTGVENFKSLGLNHPFAWSTDGKYIAGQSPDRWVIEVKEVTSGRKVATLEGNFGFLTDVQFAPDSKWILTTGSDGIAKLWALPKGNEVWKLVDRTGGMAFSPDSKTIAIANKTAIKIWDIEKRFEIASLHGHGRDVGPIAFSIDGLKLASGSGTDNTARIWNVPAQSSRGVLRGHRAAIKGLSFSHDNALIASASADKTAKIWDVETERDNLTLPGHTDEVNSTSFSTAGRLLATASQDGKVRIWDVVSGRKKQEFDTRRTGATAILNPDGTRVATGYFWGGPGVQIWDAESGKEVCSFGIDDKDALRAEFSPDGTQMTAWFVHNTVRSWDTSTCKERRRFDGNPGSEYFPIFRPGDGKLLALERLNNGRSAKLIDPETWKELSSISGHDSELWAISLSPDGSRLATAAEDGIIKIWDVATSLELLSIKPGAGKIESLAFSPDGKILAAAGADGTVRLFRSDKL